jgi:hypothetical protein
MALYLVDHHFDGEPVGVWNDALESAYLDPDGDDAKRGLSVVSGRNPQVPWSQYVSEKARAVNHRTWWSDLNSPLSLPDALSTIRREHFSRLANQTVIDN